MTILYRKRVPWESKSPTLSTGDGAGRSIVTRNLTEKQDKLGNLFLQFFFTYKFLTNREYACQKKNIVVKYNAGKNKKGFENR